jgi:hypothetical protein
VAYLEAFILEHTLDGRVFAAWGELGLKDDAEGAIAHDLALGVLHFTSLASKAILDLLADDLYPS